MAALLLDTLYGTGTSAAFAALCNVEALFPKVTAAIVEGEQADGGIYVEVVWSSSKAQVGRLVLAFYTTHVEYGVLQVAAAARGKGLYEHILLGHSAWLAKQGVKAMVCRPLGPRSEYLLMLGGFAWFEWEDAQWLGTMLPPTRVQEYRAWSEAGKPEAGDPAWHRALREAPVAGEEIY